MCGCVGGGVCGGGGVMHVGWCGRALGGRRRQLRAHAGSQLLSHLAHGAAALHGGQHVRALALVGCDDANLVGGDAWGWEGRRS